MINYKITKAVTGIKNEIKNKEGGRDLMMSDYFKTLREPLLKQQKKTNEKQDKLIEQLGENRTATTKGLQNLAESNASNRPRTVFKERGDSVIS